MTEPSPDPPSAVAEQLAGLLLEADSVVEVLQRLTELAPRIVDESMTCGITLVEHGRVLTVASADARARQLDEQQYELDEGPCLQAIDTAAIVFSHDLSLEDRWDGYPVRARVAALR